MEKTFVIENRKSIGPIGNHFSSLSWLIRAKSKEDLRLALTMIHVKDGIYFATDMHRLHVYCPNTEELPVNYILPDGNYEVITNNKNQIIFRAVPEGVCTYPDIWKILSYRPQNGIKPIKIHFGYKRDKDKEIVQLTKLAKHIYSNSDKTFRLDYLKDAIFEGTIRFEKDAQGGEFRPIVFGNDEKIAVIMPSSIK